MLILLVPCLLLVDLSNVIEGTSVHTGKEQFYVMGNLCSI